MVEEPNAIISERGNRLVDITWENLEKSIKILGRLGKDKKEDAKATLRALYLAAYYEAKIKYEDTSNTSEG